MGLHILVETLAEGRTCLRLTHATTPGAGPFRRLEVYPGVFCEVDRAGRLAGVHIIDARPSGDGTPCPRIPGARLVGVKEAAEIAGVARSNFVRDLAARPDFPRPIAELASGRVWLLSDVVAYLRHHRRAPPRPRPPVAPGPEPTAAAEVRYAFERQSGLPARVAEGDGTRVYEEGTGEPVTPTGERDRTHRPGREGGTRMKLAEALLRRRTLKERLQDLRKRLGQNARVREGERPTEEPGVLLAQIEAVLAELEALTIWINKTNMVSSLPDGMTFMEAIARRDTLRLKQEILTQAADAAAGNLERDRLPVTRSVPTVDVDALRRQVDILVREHGELEARLQEGSWRVELVD